LDYVGLRGPRVLRECLCIFNLTEKLVAQTVGLPEEDEWKGTFASIRANRSLLDDPDPVSNVLKAASNALRAKLDLQSVSFVLPRLHLQ
jgi:hypothetical protein